MKKLKMAILLAIIVSMVTVMGCGSKNGVIDDPIVPPVGKKLPELKTTQVTEITAISALVSVDVVTAPSAFTEAGVMIGSTKYPLSPVSSTNFTVRINGLTANTDYTVKAYAIVPEGTAYGNDLSFKTANAAANTITDIDGNVYGTIVIGTQTWMTSELKVKHYRDGSAIANVTDDTAWGKLTTGAYCHFLNNASNQVFYNYYAVTNSKGILPTGWHIPTVVDWDRLDTYLGNTSGAKLREAGTAHWPAPNSSTTSNNASGFTAIPTSSRDYNGVFVSASEAVWAIADKENTVVVARYITATKGYTGNRQVGETAGVSIRGIKD